MPWDIFVVLNYKFWPKRWGGQVLPLHLFMFNSGGGDNFPRGNALNPKLGWGKAFEYRRYKHTPVYMSTYIYICDYKYEYDYIYIYIYIGRLGQIRHYTMGG